MQKRNKKAEIIEALSRSPLYTNDMIRMFGHRFSEYVHQINKMEDFGFRIDSRFATEHPAKTQYEYTLVEKEEA